ncbi:MAG: hypothetical protein R3F61_29950 [Myxococcota bacterium]
MPTRLSTTTLLRTLLFGAVLLVVSVIGAMAPSAQAATFDAHRAELAATAYAAGPTDHRVAQMGPERTWSPRGPIATEAELDPPERLEPGETDEIFRLRLVSMRLAVRTKRPTTVMEWPPSVVLATRLELARAARGPPQLS